MYLRKQAYDNKLQHIAIVGSGQYEKVLLVLTT